MSKTVKTFKARIFRIVLYHLLLIVGFVVILICSKGLQNGLSALAGSLSYWLPTSLFVWRVSGHSGAHHLNRFMIALFTGEILKLLLTGVFFIILVNYAQVEVFYAMMGLIGSIVSYWIASGICLFQIRAKS